MRIEAEIRRIGERFRDWLNRPRPVTDSRFRPGVYGSAMLIDLRTAYTNRAIQVTPHRPGAAIYWWSLDDSWRKRVHVVDTAGVDLAVPRAWAAGCVPHYVFADWLEERPKLGIPPAVLAMLREPEE